MFATPLSAKSPSFKQASKRVREPFANLSPNKVARIPAADESPKAVISMQSSTSGEPSRPAIDAVAEDGAVVHASILHGASVSPSVPTASDRKLARSKAALHEKSGIAAHRSNVPVSSTFSRTARRETATSSQQVRRSMLAATSGAAGRPMARNAGASSADDAGLHCFRGLQTRVIARGEPLGPFLPPDPVRKCQHTRSDPGAPQPSSLAITDAPFGVGNWGIETQPALGGAGTVASSMTNGAALPSLTCSNSEKHGSRSKKQSQVYVVDEQDAVRPAEKQECQALDLGLGCAGRIACFEAAMPWWFRSSSEQKVAS